MTERSPTPRPWSVHKFNIRANGGRTPMAYCTASFSIADESLSVDYDAAEANAAFIVHAVNLHDEMVEALRDLNSALESNCDLPFSIQARKALGEDGVAAWLRVRFLLSKSTPTQKGE